MCSLGNLFGSLCKSCAATFDCSKNYVIMGRALEGAAEEGMQRALKAAQESVFGALEQFKDEGEGIVRGAAFEATKVADRALGARVDGIRRGILGLVEEKARHLGTITRGGDRVVDMKLGKAQLETACAIAGIDLDALFKSGEPLRRSAQRFLNYAIQDIQKYSEEAMHLWRILKTNKISNTTGLQSLYKLEVITKTQYKDLLEAYDSSENPLSFFKDIVSARSFLDVPAKTKAVFIQVAPHFDSAVEHTGRRRAGWADDLSMMDMRRQSSLFDDDEFDGALGGDPDAAPAAKKHSPKPSADDMTLLAEKYATIADPTIPFTDVLKGSFDIPPDKAFLYNHILMKLIRAACKMERIDIRKLHSGTIDDIEQRKLLSRVRKLSERLGAICFLFDVIKESISNPEVFEIHKSTGYFIKRALRAHLRERPDFLEDLGRHNFLWSVHSETIASLCSIAARFSKTDLLRKNHIYDLTYWLKNHGEEEPEEKPYASPASFDPLGSRRSTDSSAYAEEIDRDSPVAGGVAVAAPASPADHELDRLKEENRGLKERINKILGDDREAKALTDRISRLKEEDAAILAERAARKAQLSAKEQELQVLERKVLEQRRAMQEMMLRQSGVMAMGGGAPRTPPEAGGIHIGLSPMPPRADSGSSPRSGGGSADDDFA
jgi:hypothetical protein